MNLLAALIVTVLSAADEAAPDWRDLRNGLEIPSEGYCDQPYVVTTQDGHWVCVMTTGPGEEGGEQQHVVSTISTDQGQSWGPLVDIEPQGPPEASWAMPLVVPGGRIYVFYVYNTENRRAVEASTDYARKRVDTLGDYVFKYSDDGGQGWSADRYPVPVRAFDIDRANGQADGLRIFWGVGKPLISGDAVYIGLSKIGALGEGFIEKSEGVFLKSTNILSESDPAKILWETLPDGDVGLRAPEGPIAEEHNLTALSDGTLYCTYRTTQGYPCHAYSSDGGHSWTPPAYMAYAPDGALVKHPRAANFVRRFSNGKYLYWFHNHGGKDYHGRNPVWVAGGIERNGAIHWTQPEILLYDANTVTRMSYPDFIEQDGRYWVTETQKSVARVHEIPAAFLDALWGQFDRAAITKEGQMTAYPGNLIRPGAYLPLPRYPKFGPADSLTLDLTIAFPEDPPAGRVLELKRKGGVALAIGYGGGGSIIAELDSGAAEARFSSEPGVIKPGTVQHVAVIIDRPAGILSFVVDGRLLDGGNTAVQGWFRVPAALGEFTMDRLFRLAGEFAGSLELMRVYERALTTTEVIGNHRAAATN